MKVSGGSILVGPLRCLQHAILVSMDILSWSWHHRSRLLYSAL